MNATTLIRKSLLSTINKSTELSNDFQTAIEDGHNIALLLSHSGTDLVKAEEMANRSRVILLMLVGTDTEIASKLKTLLKGWTQEALETIPRGTSSDAMNDATNRIKHEALMTFIGTMGLTGIDGMVELLLEN